MFFRIDRADLYASYRGGDVMVKPVLKHVIVLVSITNDRTTQILKSSLQS